MWFIDSYQYIIQFDRVIDDPLALMTQQNADFRDATTTYLSRTTHHAIMHQNRFAEVHCCDTVLLCCYSAMMLRWLLMCAVLV